MRRSATILLCAIVLFLVAVPVAQAGDRPDNRSQNASVAGQQHARQQGQRFYGYVPPPPIQHTWAGGYRVIIHEMTNTLLRHITGNY